MRSEEARRAWGPGSHTGIVLPREERSAGHRKSFLPILVRAGFFFFPTVFVHCCISSTERRCSINSC